MELNLTRSEFECLYPFFIALDLDGKIVSYGRSAAKCFQNIQIGSNGSDIFTVRAPTNFLQENDYNKLVHKVVTIYSATTQISFNGEVLLVNNGNVFFFAITPLIQNVDALTNNHLTYVDFAVYSPLFDFFILIQAERFARQEQTKAYALLEEQNAYSKLNLEIANFCSRCFDISDAWAYIFPLLERSLRWKGNVEEVGSAEKELIKIDKDQITFYLEASGIIRYKMILTSGAELSSSGSINYFITSLKYTLENVIIRMDQFAADQENQALKVMSSKMYTLAEMSASIAHELNNPLAIIQGLAWMSSSLLEGDQIPLAKLNQNMTKIIAMTERSSKIIKGLRVFARDGTDDPMELIELNCVIEETLELCKAKIKSRGVSIEWQPGDTAFSTGKAVQISQVLLNLLNNSADAIETQKDPWIKVSYAQKDHFWIVSVTDSGKGIAPEVVKKMMSPFFTTKPAGKGTGLGLSISNSILKSHGGNFWHDADCENTRFCFSLPIFQS
jgi:C4-dicarboxylate-specific signal transduction histidine kinase